MNLKKKKKFIYSIILAPERTFQAFDFLSNRGCRNPDSKT